MSATSYLKEATQLVVSRLTTKWATGAFAGIKIIWPGVEGNPPADGSKYIELTVLWGAAARLTQANENANEVAGILHVNAFAAPNTGLQDALDLIDAVRQMVTRFTIDGTHVSVWFGPMSGPAIVGPTENWLQMAASCPLQAIESLQAVA